MATRDEILSAVEVVKDFAGNPDVGVIAELLRDLAATAEETKTSTATKEVRVVDAKETR